MTDFNDAVLQRLDRLVQVTEQQGTRIDRLIQVTEQHGTRIDRLVQVTEQHGEQLALQRDELALLRQQQWDMHRALLEKIGETNARLDTVVGRVDHLSTRVDHLSTRVDHLAERVDGVEDRLDALGRYTVDGFQQVVGRVNVLHGAFERFVELSLEERRRVWPEIDSLKTRVSALEHGREPG